MSKASQRRETAAALSRQRYKHGVHQANQQHIAMKYGYAYSIEWYPKCMSWRAGFLGAGGIKFWGNEDD